MVLIRNFNDISFFEEMAGTSYKSHIERVLQCVMCMHCVYTTSTPDTIRAMCKINCLGRLLTKDTCNDIYENHSYLLCVVALHQPLTPYE